APARRGGGAEPRLLPRRGRLRAGAGGEEGDALPLRHARPERGLHRVRRRSLAGRRRRGPRRSGRRLTPALTTIRQPIPMSRLISTTLIDPSPWADLFPHDEEHVARLAEDIGEHGINTALQVYPIGNGRFELIA